MRNLAILTVLLYAAIAAGVARADITTSLVGYWPCNDAAASTNVVAVVGSTLTLAGAGNTSASTVAGATGLGAALTLDKTDDRIEGNVATGTGAFTIAAWLKPTTASAGSGGNAYAVGTARVGVPNERIILCEFVAGKWNIYRNSGYPTGTASDTQMNATANVWQHVLYTSNGTTTQGYLNGVQQLTVSGHLNVDAPGTRVAIGRPLATASNYFGGDVQEVRLYDRVFTAADALQLYNLYHPTRTYTRQEMSR